MPTLTRQTLIERLRAARAAPDVARQLPAWAFDQFYAEEEGTLEFEPGYRAIMQAVLDDLMFADSAAFALKDDDIERMIAALEGAQPTLDEPPAEDED